MSSEYQKPDALDNGLHKIYEPCRHWWRIALKESAGRYAEYRIECRYCHVCEDIQRSQWQYWKRQPSVPKRP